MKKTLIIISSLWIIIIFSFVIKQEYTIHTGKEVLLKTVPVDPRDLLRGDYVILNYEIAQLPVKYSREKNQTVYVLLKTDKDNVAHIQEILNSKPKKGLYIKGKTGMCPTTIPFFRTGSCIQYGIENYFVEEGTGKILERELKDGTLVKVAIDKNGDAKIKGFVKD